MSVARELPRGRFRLTGRAAGLIVIILLLATAAVVPLRQYFEQRSEIDALEQRVESLAQERAQLQQRVDRLRDRNYIETIARRCLGMVKPGEIAFVTVPKEGKPPPDAC